jgi:hypothetical protein
MKTDHQVRRLKKMLSEGKKLSTSALKTEMDEKTARKYRDTGLLPSELKQEHTWRTRVDPFEDDWPEVAGMLSVEPKLEALTVFRYLQRKYPGKFQDGQLRTLQRRVKRWRATEGPPKEVMFPQEHHPGRLSQSDFTHMGDLGITLNKQPFEHLLYHFTLTKSNWETGNICFSECFESLSEGLQRAVWELGGVSEYHQTDCLSTAVNKDGNPEEFTKRYTALLDHYRLKPKRINPGEAHENGDVEQSHFRFKGAVDQELMLRGSRDFADREEYERFLRRIFNQRNAGRREWIEIEKKMLRPLPEKKLDSFKEVEKTVSRNSTIHIDNNAYSVASQLIGEKVKVRVHAEYLEVRYAQRLVEQIPRLRGEGKHRIQYRHIIDSLLRKPGAFENYKYKQDMFPTTRFRMVYDGLLKERSVRNAAKEYLQILNLAAKESESLVDEAIRILLHTGRQIIDSTAVKEMFSELKSDNLPAAMQIHIQQADPAMYNQLFTNQGASWITLN